MIEDSRIIIGYVLNLEGHCQVMYKPNSNQNVNYINTKKLNPSSYIVHK